jgi:hypothetical protein
MPASASRTNAAADKPVTGFALLAAAGPALPAAALLVAALLMAACTGGQPAPAAGAGARASAAGRSSPGAASAVAYSACMRTHGVPNFPDPDPDSGGVPKGDAQQFQVSTAVLQTARQACQSGYPDDGSFDQRTQQCLATGDCPQALVQQILTAERRLAQCMRSHGVADWPDPRLDARGRPIFPGSQVPGRDRGYWRSDQMTATVNECQRQAPSPVPFG